MTQAEQAPLEGDNASETKATSEWKQVHTWWQSLDSDKGGRAALRRCQSSAEVHFVPAFHRLLWSIKKANEKVSADRLARVAGLVVHVRTHKAAGVEGLGGQLGKAPKGGRAPVSELRFRRALQAPDDDAAFVQLRRIVPLVAALDISAFAQATYWWNERAKKQLAADYYAHSPATKGPNS